MANLMVTIDGLAAHESKELLDFLVCERATIFRKEEPWGDNIIIYMPNNISVLTTTDNIIFFSSSDVITIPNNSFEKMVIK